MKSMQAVFARELRSASRQPVVWFVAGAYLTLHAIFFTQLMAAYSQNSANILAGSLTIQDFTLIDRVVRPLLVADTFIPLLLLPALVMRQLADEWRSGTSDLLLTYPLSESGIVMGKFLAGYTSLLAVVRDQGAVTARVVLQDDGRIEPADSPHRGDSGRGGRSLRRQAEAPGSDR